jgi:hypothetical protein
MFSACATSEGHATWWNPTTWGKNRPAERVDAAREQIAEREAVLSAAQTEAIRAARDEAHKTDAALELAPADNKAVAVAKRTNTNATFILDDLAGAPDARQIAEIKQLVQGLVAGLPAALKAQAQAEQQLEDTSQQLKQAQTDLADAHKALGAANAQLRESWDREHALANTLRNERLMRWGITGLAVLLGIGALYLKLAYGGILSGVGGALADLRKSSEGTAYAQLVNALDVNLSPAIQKAVAKAKAEAAAKAAAAAATQTVA